MIERWARKEGFLSKGLRIKYVNTDEEGFSPRNFTYDILAIGKEMLRQIKAT